MKEAALMYCDYKYEKKELHSYSFHSQEEERKSLLEQIKDVFQAITKKLDEIN